MGNHEKSLLNAMVIIKRKEGIAVPEQIRGKIPDDYGRKKGIAWYYLGGFGLECISRFSPCAIAA